MTLKRRPERKRLLRKARDYSSYRWFKLRIPKKMRHKMGSMRFSKSKLWAEEVTKIMQHNMPFSVLEKQFSDLMLYGTSMVEITESCKLRNVGIREFYRCDSEVMK